MELAGKVMVVTGGSRGLGAALCRLGVNAGMQVATCSRTPAPLPHSADALVQALDVADGEAVETFGRAVLVRFGRVDLWVNNAGLLAPIGPLADVSAAEFQALIDANVMGVFHGSATYARLVRKQPAGGILINISSGAGRHPYRGWSGYCASKAAVDRMSECLALEEGPKLRVHALAPGVIETGMQALIREQSATDFPDVERFRTMHAQGALLSPEQGAAGILQFAFAPDPQRIDEVCADLRG